MSVKKKIILIGAAIVALILLVGAYMKWVSPTKIAFFNYQVITLGEINRANDNPSIRLFEVSTDDVDDLGKYDMVFVNAMGLRITEAQRETLKEIGKKVPILTSMATNPANNIATVDSVDIEFLNQYISNGGRKNYRNMLNYVRKFIDGKKFRSYEPDMYVQKENHLLYHADVKTQDGEDIGFESIASYHKFLMDNNLWNENAPCVIITGAMGDPSDLAAALEKTGNRVYCVNSLTAMVSSHQIDSIHPSVIINMAHGRLGDNMVNYLKERNIPLLLTLNVNRLRSEWEEEKMGMNGGFLSQSVVTPEIDGAIRPYVLFAHEQDESGLRHLITMPDRLTTFIETVNRLIAMQSKPNKEKKIVIYYYKGPGQSAMSAAGMEVAPSLYNLLAHLKQSGYNVEGLPQNADELEKMIQQRGKVFGTYAQGAHAEFMTTQSPLMVTKEQFDSWTDDYLPAAMKEDLVKVNGEFPGEFMTQDGKLALAHLRFGNVVLMPQGMAAAGTDTFKIVHGANVAPPYAYVASYLWAQKEFNADAILHFGTHGSLEFTPRKQVALGALDWPDRLVGASPHFYIYTIADVGEAMIAKRRSYAVTQSHLTAPFLESALRTTYQQLTESISSYDKAAEAGNEEVMKRTAAKVRALSIELGIARELRLDTTANGAPYASEEIERIESFAEELVNEKIVGQLYTLGVAYEPERINSSLYAMAVDPIAYGLLAVDKQKGRADESFEKKKLQFDRKYMTAAKKIVHDLLENPSLGDDQHLLAIANITEDELNMAKEFEKQGNRPDMMAMMMSMGAQFSAKAKKDTLPTKSVSELRKEGIMKHRSIPQMTKEEYQKMEQKGFYPDAMMKAIKEGQEWYKREQDSLRKKNHPQKDTIKPQERKPKEMPKRREFSKEEKELARAILAIRQAVLNVNLYKKQLKESPSEELKSVVNALNGGYTSPSPGGDPIVNPNVLMTGRNLYGINAENTPSVDAWEKAKALADNTIEMYKKRHHDSIPRKVSYTLWSGEFIETEGATIAQAFYMLGVEPLRDAFGRVTDLRLIPSKDLGRPRIDVVVQTSGQLRDIAASRLFLLNRAVEMTSSASDDMYDNYVREGVVESERVLVEKGITPKEAREISTYRVFGAQNGGYGTGIQGMVTAGDRWESEKEIADVYLHNMGAFYGSEKNWEVFRQAAFEAALTRTDVVVQPRQSNTWGALSLDHVYEFMGGMNLAVRNVTGKDPDAYMSDYRNHNRMRMQEVKEAIGIESRTTIFNPTYIKEKMKGGASSAGEFSEIITNTYGWNVMKPAAIDNEMWDEIYDVYVKDKHQLGVQEFFEKKNPAALEEMSAVMMESARKGMWKATQEQLAEVAKLHTDLVEKYKPSCSGFVCNNAKLQQFIASHAPEEKSSSYKKEIQQIREKNDGKNIVMKKDTLQETNESHVKINGVVVGAFVVLSFVVLLLLIRRRRKMNQE